jgi:hypothetical protein
MRALDDIHAGQQLRVGDVGIVGASLPHCSLGCNTCAGHNLECQIQKPARPGLSLILPIEQFATALIQDQRSLYEHARDQSLFREVSVRHLLPTLLFVLSPTVVFGEWMAVEREYFSPGLQTLYVDPASVERDGNLVTIRQLIDYKWMQGNYVGTPRFLSTTARKQFDCSGRRVRPLSFTDYYGHMATGTATSGHIENDQWQPVEPQTVNHALWDIACGAHERITP